MGRGDGVGTAQGEEAGTGEEGGGVGERGGDESGVVDEVVTNREGRGDGRSKGLRLVGHERRWRGGGRYPFLR